MYTGVRKRKQKKSNKRDVHYFLPVPGVCMYFLDLCAQPNVNEHETIVALR